MLSPQDTAHAPVDFEQDVLAASRARPVLVDFWAPWCGPCRVLGPVLDRLAEEAAGAWTLVKVNTDVQPDVSARYGIRGIPAVKLFVDGQVAAEFTGALPEPAVRRWLEEHLPSVQRERLARARALLEAGERADARPLLEEALAEEPESEEARMLLALALVLEEPERAAELARGLFFPEAEAVEALARAAALPEEPEALEEHPVKEAYLAAARALREGDLDAALEGFIDVIVRERYYDDDGARKAAVALFTVLGEQDPVVQKHRPAFNRSLY